MLTLRQWLLARHVYWLAGCQRLWTLLCRSALRLLLLMLHQLLLAQGKQVLALSQQLLAVRRVLRALPRLSCLLVLREWLVQTERAAANFEAAAAVNMVVDAEGDSAVTGGHNRHVGSLRVRPQLEHVLAVVISCEQHLLGPPMQSHIFHTAASTAACW